MPSQVSAGVYSREIDLSLYAPSLSTTIFGIVGGARWGPMDEAYYIGSIPEYVDAFWEPTTQMGYAAWQYLRRGHNLQVVRVGDANAAQASAVLVDSGDANTLFIKGKYMGTRADGLTIKILAGTNEGFKIQLFEDGFLLEQWDDVLKANQATALAGSKYLTLVEADAGNTNEPKVQDVTLSGGNDGLSTLTSGDYIGTITGDTYSGLQVLSNPETIDLNIVAVPGVSEAAVINAGLSLCAARADCLFLPDPPFGLTTNEVVAWHNGIAPYDDHQAFNSSYGSLNWSWHEVYDSYTDSKVWVAPSGITAGIYAYNDQVSEVWFAPAGLTRGKVVDSLRIEHSPSQGQRDLLQGNGNAVNPFVNFSQDGIVLWGQRTLQRAPTALDRVNVRRLLLQAEKIMATVARQLVFEPTDPITWRRFEVLANSILGPIKSRRGFYDFRVICDESTNPADVIDQNKMIGKLLVKPTKTAEVLQIDWVVLSTGVEFTEFA